MDVEDEDVILDAAKASGDNALVAVILLGRANLKLDEISYILTSRACSTTPIAALRRIGDILQVEVKFDEDAK